MDRKSSPFSIGEIRLLAKRIYFEDYSLRGAKAPQEMPPACGPSPGETTMLRPKVFVVAALLLAFCWAPLTAAAEVSTSNSFLSGLLQELAYFLGLGDPPAVPADEAGPVPPVGGFASPITDCPGSEVPKA